MRGAGGDETTLRMEMHVPTVNLRASKHQLAKPWFSLQPQHVKIGLVYGEVDVSRRLAHKVPRFR